MKVEDITTIIGGFEHVISKQAYGETTFFYNKNKVLPNGVYFLTLKEKDGPNDQASNLNREGVFRVSFKPKPATYTRFFGDKPKRPPKGGSIETSRRLDVLNEWQPHAVYGWMGWTMILSPTRKRFEELMPFIEESYEQAKANFDKKLMKGA